MFVKDLKNLPLATLNEFLEFAAGTNLSVEDSFKEFVKERTKNFEIEVPAHLVAFAVDGKIDYSAMSALNHLNSLILALAKSIPPEVVKELRTKLGQDGVDVFRAAIQKLFLEILMQSKFDIDVKATLDEVSAALSDNVARYIEKETFDPLGGTEPPPDENFNFFEGTNVTESL